MTASPDRQQVTHPVTMPEVRAHWREIMKHVEDQNRATKPFIRTAIPVSVADHGRTVVLAFHEDQDFLMAVAERKRPVIEASISEVLGTRVRVEFVTSDEVTPDLTTVMDLIKHAVQR